MSGQQAAHHVERLNQGDAGAKQHAEHAIEACKLMDLHLLAQAGDLPKALREPRAEGGLRSPPDPEGDGASAEQADRPPMPLNAAADGEQQRREKGQIPREVLVHAGKPRHHVEHEEAQHQRADNDKDRGIDRGGDDFLACPVERFLVGDVARQGFAHVPGSLARLERGDVERREVLRKAAHRLRKRLAPGYRPEHP